MTPITGDRWSLPGYNDIVVTAVSGDTVSFTQDTRSFTITHEHFNNLATESLKRGATMNSPSGSHNTHARLSPSSSKQWTNCTASLAMIEANGHRIPKDTSSVYSNEGTAAHDHAANVLLKKITIDEVPLDFRPYVALYVDHCLALVPEGVSYQVEVQAPLFYQPSSTGTCDFAIITDERVTIRDYKHGAGVLVSADENTQLAIYAMSLIRTVEDVYDFSNDTVVDIGIFQPRHREAHDAVPWIITLKELTEFCDAIEKQAMVAFGGVTAVQQKLQCGKRDHAADEILACDSMIRFVPQEGDDGSCRWCDCKAWCQPRIASLTEDMSLPRIAGADLLTLLPDLDKEELKSPVTERIEMVESEVVSDDVIPEFNNTTSRDVFRSKDYLVRILAKKKAITRFLDDVEEYLEALALAGEPVEGTKLVLGREGNRAWANEEQADVFLRGQGLKQEDRYDFKLKSPTAIEKVLKDKLEKSTRTKNRFAELISRSPAKPVLALASDKRDAISAPVDLLPDLSTAEDEV